MHTFTEEILVTTVLTTRVAGTSDIDTVVRVSLEAFADEEVMTWVVPTPADRRTYMQEEFAASLDHAVRAGSVTLAFDVHGTPLAVSIWARRSGRATAGPAESPTPAEPVIGGPDAAASESDRPEDLVRRRLRIVEAATTARTPTEPHLHLSAMATAPRNRGSGAGTALLAAGLEQAQSRGLPVYLEASTSDSSRLYARNCFRDLGDPIVLPEGGPTLRPMWRT